MIYSRLAVALASVLVLNACATSKTTPRADGADPFGVSPYGLFLAGQAALSDGRSAKAAGLFEQARISGNDSGGLLTERAFAAALLAGDISRAAELAPTGDGASEPSRRFGMVVRAVEALATDKPKLAKPLLVRDVSPYSNNGLVALLAPWAAAMAGDGDGAVVRPESNGDKVVEYFGLLGQARLYERARRYDEAETDFKVLTGGDMPSDLAVLAYGEFLERRGRKLDALALYGKALVAQPRNSTLEAARTRAAAARSVAPAALSLKQGAAQAIMAPAAAMLGAKQSQVGLAYLRLALRLDPELNNAWLMVGDIMQGSHDTEGAREAYSKPKPGALEYSAAQSKLAWTYQAAKDTDTALKMARAAAAGGDLDAKVTLADLLRANEKYAESAEVLTGLLGPDPDWRLLYARGIAYDRSGRWSEGERDLQAALKMRPDDAEMLNYLGYSWIDRGEHLTEALAMVQKAVGQNPRSGAMIDSLGWAYYRLGDLRKAVETLETAVELESGDPDINNHLGDAYWQVGRKDEAQFQWRRVLTLEPDAKLKVQAEEKLAKGLAAPTRPLTPAQVAGR